MFRLLRRVGADGERVDLLLHHGAEGGIDQAVARHCVLARELRRNDGERVMAATAFGAFVSGMQGAVVAEFQPAGLERGQLLLDDQGDIHARLTWIRSVPRIWPETALARSRMPASGPCRRTA